MTPSNDLVLSLACFPPGPTQQTGPDSILLFFSAACALPRTLFTPTAADSTEVPSAPASRSHAHPCAGKCGTQIVPPGQVTLDHPRPPTADPHIMYDAAVHPLFEAAR